MSTVIFQSCHGPFSHVLAHAVEYIFSSQETQSEYDFHNLKKDKVEHVLLYHFLNDIFFVSFFIIFFNLHGHFLNVIKKRHLKNDEK